MSAHAQNRRHHTVAICAAVVQRTAAHAICLTVMEMNPVQANLASVVPVPVGHSGLGGLNAFRIVPPRPRVNWVRAEDAIAQEIAQYFEMVSISAQNRSESARVMLRNLRNAILHQALHLNAPVCVAEYIFILKLYVGGCLHKFSFR